ncbi:MAG TPA: Calx-beta domain-containing protein, partial [Pirellulales bacterium]
MPALPQGLMWQIGYTDTAVTLTVVPGAAVVATVNYTFDTGSPPAQFTFTRGGPTDDPLTVQYSVGGNAVAGMDYVPLSGTLTFPAGDGSETLNVTGALDAPWHYDPKTMSVSVTPVADSYAADTPSNAAILIYSQPYASINDVTVHTGDSDARFTVSLSNPVPRAASVDFNTEDFNATAPADYAEQHGT